ncbi:adenylate/guanylate cyclase domain-containing protein [Microvirga calopogonii]|uniref:adenylate/guanylate cyclase domain-containing protein n=1 Tax=Microvirga calopogonii TaxID=2078013 RepID=UPI001FE0BC77|nr:adenylate/guanylate cyclase domain-containing protein [Microvirga calopogonii]
MRPSLRRGSNTPSGLSIRLALAGISAATIAVTAAALVLVLESGRQNTSGLVRDRSDRILTAVVERIRMHLEPARDQSRFLARMVADGLFNPRDDGISAGHLSAALAGTPQVATLAIIRTDLRQIRVERQGDTVVTRSISMRTVPGLHDAFAEARRVGQPLWGELLWSERLNQPLVNIRTPLWHQDDFVGILLAGVTVAELSTFVVDVPPTAGAATFILHGREFVLAHAGLARTPSLFKPDHPLPQLAELGDEVLASIWNQRRDTEAVTTVVGPSGGHAVDVNGIPYVFLYRELAGYSEQPWLIGRYMPLADLTGEVRRLEWAAWIGLAAVLVAIAGAWFMGHAVARPILRLATATAAIRDLDLGVARPLARSSLREVDEAIGAYNALLTTLHWFERYVPRNLVSRLMAQEDGDLVPEERVVTVLFTDVVAFTGLAERLTASETAAFLNEHFRLMAACVEAQQGTIDKFIGDSLMAFWGAPDAQPDQAEQACRTARAMAAAIIADNYHRREHGLEPVRVRIGIHTGPAIVGNIGAPGRINYTIVGDAVNMAQRIEEVAKEHLAAEGEVVVLASEAVLEAIGQSVSAHEVRRYTLRGRRGATTVVRLL